jgi:hypothetical protein
MSLRPATIFRHPARDVYVIDGVRITASELARAHVRIRDAAGVARLVRRWRYLRMVARARRGRG